jgi:hypothetical protein
VTHRCHEKVFLVNLSGDREPWAALGRYIRMSMDVQVTSDPRLLPDDVALCHLSMDVQVTSDPRLLPDDVALCHQMIRALIQTLQHERRTNAGLQQQLAQLLRRLYGPRGEKFDPQAYALFPELKALLYQPAPATATAPTEATPSPSPVPYPAWIAFC